MPFNADFDIFTKEDMINAIYVDNLLIYNAEKKNINNIKKALKAKFYIFDLGSVSFYLEMTVTQDYANRIIFLGQSTYLKKIL